MQVVQLDLERILVVLAQHVLANALPVAHPHGLLAAVAGEFAVEKFATGLLLAQDLRSNADAVDIFPNLLIRICELPEKLFQPTSICYFPTYGFPVFNNMGINNIPVWVIKNSISNRL